MRFWSRPRPQKVFGWRCCSSDFIDLGQSLASRAVHATDAPGRAKATVHAGPPCQKGRGAQPHLRELNASKVRPSARR
eukprot:6843901-Karenia_brevis.AAC.1